jgi:hypothetical protein
MGVIEVLPEMGSRDPEWNKIFVSGIWTQFRLARLALAFLFFWLMCDVHVQASAENHR